MNTKNKKSHLGKITRISGTVLDVQFDNNEIPNIHNLLYIEQKNKVYLEVVQQLGDAIVRCITLEGSDELSCGLQVIDTGEPVKVPVGKEVLGRLFNVLGHPIDNLGPVKTKDKESIYYQSPNLIDQDISNSLQETGIKIIDLMNI